MAARYIYDILVAAAKSEITLSLSVDIWLSYWKISSRVKCFWYFAIDINPIERKSNLAWETAAIEDTFDVLDFHVQFVSSQVKSSCIFLSKKQSVSYNLR